MRGRDHNNGSDNETGTPPSAPQGASHLFRQLAVLAALASFLSAGGQQPGPALGARLPMADPTARPRPPLPGPQPSATDDSGMWVAFAQAQPRKPPPKPRTRKAPPKRIRKAAPPPAAASQPATQPAAPTRPTTRPAHEPILAARERLSRIAPAQRTLDEHALLTTIDFALALAAADGSRAASLVDVVGYQPLPLEDELPERPDKPALPAVLEQQIAARQPAQIERLTADDFDVLTRDAVRARFAAVATWMLPEDRAVVSRPPAQPLPGWVQREACLVIRVRAGKATIVGGNLLEALAP